MWRITIRICESAILILYDHSILASNAAIASLVQAYHPVLSTTRVDAFQPLKSKSECFCYERQCLANLKTILIITAVLQQYIALLKLLVFVYTTLVTIKLN